ncbi:hypothetical protein R69619_03734 [Paraburkholderia nemoris]|uniref:putative PDDEXK endonuclease n=1 Tax=Paraburkholderia nemoris TaxID=2793076 RepID=UPI00190AB0A5|nr:hypothetical protein [Paraburkholderia nemoris]MBK3743147.1 hypothetical protein [Paraburkholderia aspalathi]CAE6768580.1 hypothetical protein R69619_03734 [Paraburkholderia nemoris]
MGAMQRRKGGDGEREIAALVRDLTGWDVRRRVRQHEGDSDLEGVPGWCVEVKRHARATRADVRGWWEQTVRQAASDGLLPVLFWRQDRDEWRGVWPVALLLGVQCAQTWMAYALSVEGTVEAWAAVARNINASSCPRYSVRWKVATAISDLGNPSSVEAFDRCDTRVE